MAHWTDKFRVDIPESEYNGIKVIHFEIPEFSLVNFQNTLDGRGSRPGFYTKLVEITGTNRFGEPTGKIWMSDVDAEVRDHLDPFYRAQEYEATHILINGLGLGCLLKALLTLDHIQHIDVVERDERVIKLVAPSYPDPRVNIVQADAYQQMKAWPRGTSWTIAWHDIWPDICADNLSGMARFHRSYGKRVTWQGSWAKDLCQKMARQERKYSGWIA